VAKIQTPQHVQKLQAEFKVREAFDLDLLETIQPVVQTAASGAQVASQAYPRECIGSVIAPAGGVGTNVQCQFTGLGGLGIIYLVRRVSFAFPTGPGSVDLRVDDGVGLVANTPVLTKRFSDLRIPAALPDALLGESSPLTAAPDGEFIARYQGLASTELFIDLDIVLGDGLYLLTTNRTANEALRTVFYWTEYLLEDR